FVPFLAETAFFSARSTIFIFIQIIYGLDRAFTCTEFSAFGRRGCVKHCHIESPGYPTIEFRATRRPASLNWDFREPAEERAALLAEFTAKESDADERKPKKGTSCSRVRD